MSGDPKYTHSSQGEEADGCDGGLGIAGGASGVLALVAHQSLWPKAFREALVGLRIDLRMLGRMFGFGRRERSRLLPWAMRSHCE